MVTGLGSGYYFSVVGYNDIECAPFTFTEAKFRAIDHFPRYQHMSVRLATVVSGLTGGCVLFLPAAGLRNGGGLDRSGIANFYNSRTFAEWFWAQEAGFRAPYVTNTHHRAYSVRLATVVSDSTGMIVLFLPAAGYRDGGAGVWSAGTAGFYLAPRRYQNSNAWVIRFGESGIELPVGWIKYFMGTTVRLATVVSGLAGVSFCSCLLRAGFRKTIGFIRVITVITIVVMQIQMCVQLCAL